MSDNTYKKIKKSDLSITVILLIGILIVVNFFSYQIFYRWDLTQGKVFSISKASKKTVGELEDIVNIKAYFSESLPNQFLSLRQEVGDVLDEYRAFSNGRINVEFIDPTGDDSLQRELMSIGIPQLSFEVYEKDKVQLVNGYMGIGISFGDKTEVIPAVKSETDDLEYQLTTAIKKVVSSEIATVGFVTTQGTASLENSIKQAYQGLSELYSVQEAALDDNDPKIATNIDTLIVAGPKEVFNDKQMEAINKFLIQGGALVVLYDGVVIGNGLQSSKNTSNLNALLAKYGINIKNNLAADSRSGIASFSQGFFTFSSNYPFWPKITGDGFDKNNGAVSNLENVIMPWASTIDIDETKIDKSAYTRLAQTSAKSWTIEDNFDVTPNNTSPRGAQEARTLAVSVNGLVSNPYYKEGSDGQKNFSARIVAVADSDFLNDNFVANTPDNLTFFQNLVDSLSLDQDLISIRSKSVTSRPIKELTDGGRAFMRYANIFGLTFVVVAFGLLRYFMRRRSRFVDEL